MILYRHRKTGGLYEILSVELVSLEFWAGALLPNDTLKADFTATDHIPADSWVVFYQNVETLQCWARVAEMFFDGRFEQEAARAER